VIHIESVKAPLHLACVREASLSGDAEGTIISQVHALHDVS
jgi:hypothetical protein